ncbi:M14 family zinc carboxypeptidase [Lacimicrobium sp. SS2-24]|uniref:M14 family zinc carboxypeptidase n=1 Tax=Lacimicrobium sp. SS2-24 TaxID=2005569 RepID=UPI000B4B2740|nr:M14 family zinc carboxypeptidase [Lacimicrobium sp. SS2-24]
MKKFLITMALFSHTALSASLPPASEYEVPQLNKPQIRQADILPYLEKVKQNPLFRTEQVGESYLNRPVYRISIGEGPVTVLMWSQMHGDESTATPALFDLINRIDKDQRWRQSWTSQLTLHMIPMLNPDGAELAQRHNAQSIDINRDARDLQTPEGRILMQQAQQLEPDFGFNLHDQSRFYSAGPVAQTATISLLAPAFDEAKSISPIRQRAMQLIGVMKQVGDELIPEKMGRYDDTYAHRAFGDTLAGMNISTILIEAGAYPGDLSRQAARRVTLAMLETSLDSIASKSYLGVDLGPYHDIPMNEREAFRDVIIQDLHVNERHSYRIDIALDLDLPEADRARIKDVGDLSPFYPFFEFDASDWHYQSGKAYALTQPIELTDGRYLELLQEGYSHFEGDAALLNNQSELPVVINHPDTPAQRPQRNDSAVFFMQHKNGRKIAVLNGLLIDLSAAKVLNSYNT